MSVAISMSQGVSKPEGQLRASAADYLVVDLNKDGWYDLDGDGKKEFLAEQYYNKMFRLNQDATLAEPLSESYKNYGGALATLSNFGLDAPGFAWQAKGDHDYKIYRTAGLDSPIMIDTIAGQYGTSINYIDIDNNGINDVWVRNYKDDSLMGIMGSDGKLIYGGMSIMSPTEYYDYIVTHPGSGLGLGMSVIGGGEGNPGAYGSFQQVDINNDGLMDYILPATGEYLMSIGNGSFVKDQFSGKIYFRDFNGDGINDVLRYNSKDRQLTLTYQKKEGEPETRKLLSSINCEDNIWCKDFDKDGDVDILVAVYGVRNQDWDGYLIMFENNGDGSFKKHEHYIENGHIFLDCLDIDNDGNYEVFFLEADPKPTTSLNYRSVTNGYLWYVKLDGVSVAETAVKVSDDKANGRFNIEEDYPTSPFMIAVDPNSSGRVMLYSALESNAYAEFTPFAFGNRVNTRPARMAKPSLVYDEDAETLDISWTLGEDNETAPLDLTYELRIGTTPDKCDILWTDALPDGRRRNFKEGNCGFSTTRRLNTSSWPEGNIYVSVQAIDGNMMGSEFSECAVLEKKTPAADFLIVGNEAKAVREEVEVRLLAEPMSSTTYVWNFDGAEIVSESAEGAVVRWTRGGEKDITLTATAASGKSLTVAKKIMVIGAKLVVDESLSGCPKHSVDLDADGINELFVDKFYEADGEGGYTAIKKMFNNNLSVTTNTKSMIVDINRDGKPDLFHYEYSGRNFIQHVLNEGDKSMQIEEFDCDGSQKLLADFDNDGFADGVVYNIKLAGLARNTGDYKQFETTGLNGYAIQYYDYDGDGFMDIIVDGKVYRNLGNFNFELDETYKIEHFTDASPATPADIDGDGRMDVVCSHYFSGYGMSSYSDYLYIYWGDGTVLEIPAPAGTQFSIVEAAVDLDNNGCSDVVIDAYNGETSTFTKHVVFFNRDRSYNVASIGMNNQFKASGTGAFYRRADGKMGLGQYMVIGPDNTLPTAPTGIKMTETDDCYIFSWEPASDAETHSEALKYNVSLKLKGKNGEQSYIWSPLNDGKNGVPVPSCAQLLVSPGLPIPKTAMGAGDYEFKVQAVDTQMECGDFSETFEFTISMENFIAMPEETMVGKRNLFRLFPGIKVGDIDFGADAVVENADGLNVTVYWTSEGVKTVTYCEYTKTILVHPALNAYFHMPDEVYYFSKVAIDSDNVNNSQWSVEGLPYPGSSIYPQPFNPNFNVEYVETGENTGYLYMGYDNSNYYKLRITHTLTTNYGEDSYSKDVAVVFMKDNPYITIVDIDETSNRHRLQWSLPEEQMAGGTHNAVSTNIYKETSEYGVFELIGKLSAEYTDFIDDNSDPDRMASRYALSYNLEYGETQMSVVHRPIHMQVSNGGANTWNLFWGEYEGRNITTYRILRGNSPQTLECIAEVAGSVTSFTDYNAPADVFYAIEIFVDPSTRASDFISSRSNVVSVADVSVGQIRGEGFSVATDGGDLIVGGDSQVRVYNTQGVLLYSGAPGRISDLPSGLLLVVTANGSASILI